MLRRSISFFKKPVWKKAPVKALPAAAISASQELRKGLDQNSQRIRPTTLDLLSQMPREGKYPLGILKLLNQALDSGNLQVDDLVKMFTTVAPRDAKGDLTTKLFIKLYKSPKVPNAIHLQNAKLYFEWLLRFRPHEASKFIQGVLKVYDYDHNYILELLDIIETTQSFDCVPVLLESSVHPDVIQKAFILLTEAGQKKVLEEAIDVVGPVAHDLSKESLVVILDSLISMKLKGSKFLATALTKPKDSLEYLEILLMAVMRFGEDPTLGYPLVGAIESDPSQVKETTDLLLQWSVYSSSDLTKFKELAKSVPIDSATLSGVLAVADIARRSEKDIQEIIDLFSESGVDKNSESYSILIRRALAGVEVEKARELFYVSMNEGVDWQDHAATLHDLLCELCKASTIDDSIKFDVYQRIRTVTNSPLNYESQVEMLRMFLSRKSTSDIAKYLIEQWGESPGLDANLYQEIYDSMYQSVMQASDYRRMWDLYTIFNSAIKLPYDSYLPIQKRFCELGRPDAAHLMFRHLRNRAKKEGIQPPNREIYMYLFLEYGKWHYEEGLVELETYFRMDIHNDMDIGIMNGMLAAYSELQDSPKVSDLWLETDSFPAGKGFNNLTATILLKHLAPFSLEAVDDLWQALPSKYGVKPDSKNLEQYVVANCYHGYYSRALEIAKSAPEVYGLPVNSDLIKTLYNWTLIESRKEAVKSWAIEQFPNEWAQLESNHELKNILIGANPDNDSEQGLRGKAIEELIESEGPKQVALHRTTDPD